MSRSLRPVCVALCAAMAGLTVLGRAACGQPPRPAQSELAAVASGKGPIAKPKSLQREAEEAIRRALARPVTVDFDETPLEDAAAFLQDLCGIPVLLDLRTMKEVGVEPDAPISLRVSNISLRSALRLLLRQLGLTYVVRDEVLMITYVVREDAVMITAPRGVERPQFTRVHPLGEIVPVRGSPVEAYYDYDLDFSLSGLITTCIQPRTWPRWEGARPVSMIDVGGVRALAFTQTAEVHEEVATLLAALRTVARQTAVGKTPEPILFDHIWPEPPAYASVRQALSRNVSLAFDQTPLADVVDHLRSVTGINIVLDHGALADLDVAEDTLISVKAEDMPLQAGLQMMLRKLGLTHQVWDEVLLITTPDEADMRLSIGVYPVGDLIAHRHGGSWAAPYDDVLWHLITHCIQPSTWGGMGGPPTLSHLDLENLNILVVVHTRDVHQQIADLLARLRNVARQSAENDAADLVKLLRGLFGGMPLREPTPLALSRKVRFDFNGTPLREVAKSVTRTCGIPCRLDQQALKEAAVSSETPVSVRISGVTLRSALELALEQLDLTWVLQDGALLITTPDEATGHLRLDLYPVGDLVTFRDQNGTLWQDYDWLIQVIQDRVLYREWGWVAGGTLAGAEILAAYRTDRVHEQIAQLLAQLREIASQASDDGQPPRRNRYSGG